MIKFDAETHEYKVDGIKKPSVTHIISEALHEDLSEIPEGLMKRATEWGTAVHEKTHLFDWGMLDMSGLAPVLVKSLEAWSGWIKDYEILESEKQYYADGFCGTIDRVLRKEDQLYIVDIKTCSALKRKVGLQLSAYAHLYGVNEYVGWDDLKLLAVQIDQHGNIKVKEYENEYPVFQAMMTVWEWENRFKRK